MTDVARSSDMARPMGHVPRDDLGWLLHPYLFLFVGGLLDATGERLLKQGANSAPVTTGLLHWFSTYLGVSALASMWTWVGILSYIAGLLCWLHVLRCIPISIAFPVINVLHMAVPVGAHVFLHEPVPVLRWVGIGIALSGVLLILKPVARAEEKL